jgi:hypothetical protein
MGGLAPGLAVATPADSARATAPAVAAAPSAAAPDSSLFLVELSLGPRWDASKPPNAQAGFREHSANLGRMRQSGGLVIGARAADLGVLLMRAPSDSAVRAEFAADPMVRDSLFVATIRSFSPFYGGCLTVPPRRSP